MSKADFSGKQTYTTGHALTASDLNSWQDGVQDELEKAKKKV